MTGETPRVAESISPAVRERADITATSEKPLAYYNEIDPFAAATLRELIADGLIAPGDVDERSITDVRPADLAGYRQHHFFAGFGVWSAALRLAGWPDDEPVWTASCPCPPFSSAGPNFRCPLCDTRSPVPNAVRTGAFDCIRCGHEWQADGRHLFPELFRLIRECGPECVLGEQVASADGRTWIDVVSASLEMLGYAVGSPDTCAAGFGAPHIRQRLYWVADAVLAGRPERWASTGGGSAAGGGVTSGLVHSIKQALEGLSGHGDHGHEPGWIAADTPRPIAATDDVGGMADSDSGQRNRIADGKGCVSDGTQAGRQQGDGESERGRAIGRLADAGRRMLQHQQFARDDAGAPGQAEGQAQQLEWCGAGDRVGGIAGGERPGPTNGLWRATDWLACTDGKWRPVEPGTFPLANAGTFRNRVAELRGAGNAINLAQAAGFIEAVIAHRATSDRRAA